MPMPQTTLNPKKVSPDPGSAGEDKEASEMGTMTPTPKAVASDTAIATRSYSGYGTIGNVAVVACAAIGSGVIANALGSLASPTLGFVLGCVAAIASAVLVTKDNNRVIQG